jgi:hypothetical protein
VPALDDVADLRIELARRWGPGGDLLHSATGRDGPAAARYTARWEQAALAGAELWWLPAATCQLLGSVYPSVPDDLILDVSGWQLPKGLAVFEAPVDGRQAILWGPRAITRGGETFPTTTVSCYSRQLDPFRRTVWPLAEPLGIARLDPGADLDDRRVIASLWLLDAQPAIAVEARPLATLAALRARRAGYDTRPVRILHYATTERSPTATSGHAPSPRWRRKRYGAHHSLSKLVLVGAH